MEETIKIHRKKNHGMVFALVAPTALWLVFFLLIPLVYVVSMSFMEKGLYGGVESVFTLENYRHIFKDIYMKVTWKSVVMAFQTSLICLLISYPFAYVLCKLPKKKRGFMTLLIMLPFWVNGLLRLNGWTNILRESGILNKLLMNIGLIDEPLQLIHTKGAVLFGMVYCFFPFMVLPLQTSISKIDHSLIEAAHDLGAKKIRTFFRVILPMTLPGIFAGTIQVFIPSLGAFYVADVMGGGSAVYLGNIIQDQFLRARNWPFGAAFSVLLIIFTLIMLKLYSKVGDLDDLA